MDTPYYLSPNVAPIPMGGSIDLFNYDTLQGTAYDGSVASIWDELASIPEKAGNWVYDSATGTWSAVSGFASDAADSLTGSFNSLMSTIKTNLILVIGGFLVIVWVIAKSGILGQSAQVLGGIAAVKG